MEEESNLVDLTPLAGGIWHLSLNRPQQLNALSLALLHRLSVLFKQAAEDTTVKAILLTGVGKGFCAGADIKQLLPLDVASGLAYAIAGQKIFRQLELLGKPSLAAMHGFALGGGCELAMAASLRIAARETYFSQPEIKLGLIPGFGGTQRLARLIGKGRALDLCLTGRQFKAEEALEWGLITRLTDKETLLPTALEMLNEITSLSSLALKSMLSAMHQGLDLPLDQALALEAAHFGICCGSADKEEGVKAFLEKRSAQFTSVI
jgi:enoyl-CoA hydratase